MRDAAAAWQLGLRWKLSGDDKFATAAVKILNDWAAKCKKITSNDANQVLAAGAQGYTFANAGELLQTFQWMVRHRQEDLQDLDGQRLCLQEQGLPQQSHRL